MKENNKNKNEQQEENSENLPYNPEITHEDKQALNEKGRSMNKGQDKALDRDKEVDFTARKMDIPASNDSKPQDRSDLVDEENMQYNEKGARLDHKRKTEHPGSDKKI